MAWLAREKQPITTIALIQNADGSIEVDPVAINARFSSYYGALYFSRVDYSVEKLDSFLGHLTFPTLSDEARAHS